MDSFQAKVMEAGQVFTPGSPVNERDLFAGRIVQLNRILEAVTQRGYHAVLFGERGVGKTSLANILLSVLRPRFLMAKVNCDASDNFQSIWKKAFQDITHTQVQQGIGFVASESKLTTPIADTLPLIPQPDDVRRILSVIGAHNPTLIILDEFDRISDKKAAVLISDTIKALSDSGSSASILLIGVAESVGDLVEGHLSIERALVQIPMPRMSDDEIEQIFAKGMERLGMQMDGSALSHLRDLSQGLPYIAHLLALHATRAALNIRSMTITRDHVDRAITSALEQWQQSIKTAYYDAVKSQQPGAIFEEVLLACAIAEVDELGYFSAAAVRSPLTKILDRPIDIPNFARHLKEFSQESRGAVITRVGTKRRLRYRFSNPLMRAYIIMRGFEEKRLGGFA